MQVMRVADHILLGDEVVPPKSANDGRALPPAVFSAATVRRLRSMVRTTVLIKGPGVEKPGSRAAQLEYRNRQLEQRIAWQEGEIGRLAGLKRFVAPQVADILLSGAGSERLQVHQSEIVVLFCDLRGFTAFAEAVSPDELMTTLREYHGVLGPLVREFEGTLNHFAGDGVMVFFNDPTPCINPPLRAVSLAAAIKRDLSALAKRWRKRGYDLGFGIGLAQGVATIGQIGSSTEAIMRRSARSRTSQPACAPKRRTDRFSSRATSPQQSGRAPMLDQSAARG